MTTSIFHKILHLTFSRSTAIIANMMVMIFASRYLSMADYASYRQTFLPYEVLAPILSLGIPPTIYYLLPRRLDKLNLVLHSIVIMLLCVLVFSGFLMFGGIEFISKLFHNPDLVHSLRWLIIYPVYQIPITLLLSVFIFEGKTKFIGIYSSIFAVIFSASAIFIIISYKSYLDVVMIRSLLPIVGGMFLLGYLLKLYDGENKNKLGFVNSTKDILKTSIPFGFASMIGLISLQLDKVLVSSLGTTDEFAIYVNGAMEIPLIGVLTGSISNVLIGELSKSIKEHNYKRALELFRLTAAKTALILFPVMIFFIFNAREFMTLLYSEKYELSAIPFTIYLFLLPIRIVVFGSILVAMGKSKVILYRSILELVLNVILSIWMFKLFGYLGIAVATVLVTYLWAVPYNILIISKEFNIKRRKLFDIRQLSKIMIVACILIPVMNIPYSITELNTIYIMDLFGFSQPEVIFFLKNINSTYANIIRMGTSFLMYTALLVVFYRYFNIINYKKGFKKTIANSRECNELR